MTTRKLVRSKQLMKLALTGVAAGAMTLGACNTTENEDTQDAAAKQSALDTFIEECEAAGNTVERHDTCGGSNSCMGTSFDLDKGKETSHDCQGKNTCRGASCIEGEESESTEGASNNETSPAAKEAALKAFIEECEAAGKTVEEHSCNGMNDCGGVSFNKDTGEKKTHGCKGYATCNGATCRE